MSSKFHVFTPWQEFDKDATVHIIKASTPFNAALAYAIREWGLYHAAEKAYEVYDQRGTLRGRYTIPDWVDDSFGTAMKEAFLVEVITERNEYKGAPDANGVNHNCGPQCGSGGPSASPSSYTISAPSSSAPIDWSTAACGGCSGATEVYLNIHHELGNSSASDYYDYQLCLSSTPVQEGTGVRVGDTLLSASDIALMISALPHKDTVVIGDCLGSCGDETTLRLLRADGVEEREEAHIAIEYVERLAALVGLAFTRPTSFCGTPIKQASSTAVATAEPQTTVVNEEGPAMTADQLEFAAHKDGTVVLQGSGYFDFYGGLDDETTPLVAKDLRCRHGLEPYRGNTFKTCYSSGAEAIAALKVDGLIHCPELQAFIEA